MQLLAAARAGKALPRQRCSLARARRSCSATYWTTKASRSRLKSTKQAATPHTSTWMLPTRTHGRRAVDTAVERYGKVDILVNNAGVAFWTFGDDASVEDWDTVMDINAKGVFLGTKAVIPAMRDAGGGSIVNISSISGMIGQATIHPGYNASKGAVRLLTKSTAIQYAKEGIRCNSVHPGPVRTAMTERGWGTEEGRERNQRNTPLGRYADPDEIASGVLFLASEESSYMTGSELVIDGGVTAQ